MLAMQNTDRISYVLLFLYWLSTWQIPSSSLQTIILREVFQRMAGQFSFLFPDSMSPESQLLMKSLILGLTNIRDEYGAEYINFRFREV